MSKIPITIELLPNQVSLDKNRFDQILLETIKTQYTHKCTRQYGYILRVLRVLHIHKKFLSIYNGNIVVNCEVEVNNLIPEIGKSYQAVIRNIYPQGLIVLVENCIRVFIPGQFSNKKVNQQIHFKCIQVRFKKGTWDCIGELHDYIPSNLI